MAQRTTPLQPVAGEKWRTWCPAKQAVCLWNGAWIETENDLIPTFSVLDFQRPSVNRRDQSRSLKFPYRRAEGATIRSRLGEAEFEAPFPQHKVT